MKPVRSAPPIRLAEPLYLIRVSGRDPRTGRYDILKEARAHWLKNAMSEARIMARTEERPARITHRDTDRELIIGADGNIIRGNLDEYFDPCQCGCGRPTCETSRK